ncbi:MAG TPA: hypothetical protein VLH94_00990 [Spirochaetia bacterium]|nr:hypothetical protein [Spirochaetia bacterium]
MDELLEQRIDFGDTYYYYDCGSKILPILKEFAKKTGKNLVLIKRYDKENWHSPDNCKKEDTLYICFHHPPTLYPYEALTVGEFYGIRLKESQRDCFVVPQQKQSWVGRKIYDNEGYEVAVICKKSLYILFDLLSGCEDNIGSLLKMILDDYFLYLSHPILFGREMKKRSEGKLREHFNRSLRTGSKEVIAERILDERGEIIDLQEWVTILALSRKFFKEEAARTSGREVVDMYRRMCKFSSNGKIEIKFDDTLRIPVGQIDIEHKGVIYDIGDIAIEVDVTDGTVRCINTTRVVNDYHHPNFSGRKKICLHEATYGFAVLLGEMKLDVVLQMVMEVLRSYDERNCFEKIESWPIKEKISDDTAMV